MEEMNVVDAAWRLRHRASRRISQSGLQRRESLVSNKLSKFSKSLGTIPSLYDSASSIPSPTLRRCKSEEILPSWDHFSDSSSGLLRKKTLVTKIETHYVSNDTPQASPVTSPTKRGKGNTIILESASLVAAGSIESLVDHLTDLQFITGTQYMEHFLFTYRYFMTAEQLLVKLGERYACIPSPDLTPEELQNHENLAPIQKLRVINVFKKWVENHVHDFSDVHFLQKFIVFLEEVVSVDNQKWAEHLRKIVEARIIKAINEGKASDDIKKFTVKSVKLKNIQSLMTIAALLRRCEIVSKRKKSLRTYKHAFYGNEAIDWLNTTFQLPRSDAVNLANQLLRAGFIKHHNESNNKERTFKDKNKTLYVCNASLLSTEPEEEFPKPLRPKTTSFSFLDLHPVEVARQLTLIEFKLFEKIIPQELSHQAWNKKNGKEMAPHVTALIDRSNEVSYWVATEIVMTPNSKQRVSVLSRFIDIAQICHDIRNWNTLMELMVGLNLGCVTRLKKTWEAIPKHTMAVFENLTKLTSSSSNYLHYREALAAKELPFSPNLAVHLRDLTFIEDGNDDTVGEECLINFTKMHMLAAVFEEVYRMQSARYNFKEIKAMTKYLTQGIYVLRIDKELYKRSTMCEPSVRTMSMMNKTRSGRFLTLTRSSHLINKSI